MNIAAIRRFLGLLGILPAAPLNTAITTVGAGTLTAASLVGRVITRSGPTNSFTDTTVTATVLLAAMPVQPAIGTAWVVTYRNTTAYAATIAGGTGVTATGNLTVPANSTAEFLLTYSASGAFTLLGLGWSSTLNALPPAKFATAALEAATLAAADITGANFVAYTNTGTTPAALTVPTAAAMFAAHPNAVVGSAYVLAIRNGSGSANTATLTADGGATVTLTGTMTIAQNVTRLFVVTFTSATAATIQSIGISAAGA